MLRLKVWQCRQHQYSSYLNSQPISQLWPRLHPLEVQRRHLVRICRGNNLNLTKMIVKKLLMTRDQQPMPSNQNRFSNNKQIKVLILYHHLQRSKWLRKLRLKSKLNSSNREETWKSRDNSKLKRRKFKKWRFFTNNKKQRRQPRKLKELLKWKLKPRHKLSKPQRRSKGSKVLGSSKTTSWDSPWTWITNLWLARRTVTMTSDKVGILFNTRIVINYL